MPFYPAFPGHDSGPRACGGPKDDAKDDAFTNCQPDDDANESLSNPECGLDRGIEAMTWSPNALTSPTSLERDRPSTTTSNPFIRKTQFYCSETGKAIHTELSKLAELILASCFHSVPTTTKKSSNLINPKCFKVRTVIRHLRHFGHVLRCNIYIEGSSIDHHYGEEPEACQENGGDAAGPKSEYERDPTGSGRYEVQARASQPGIWHNAARLIQQLGVAVALVVPMGTIVARSRLLTANPEPMKNPARKRFRTLRNLHTMAPFWALLQLPTIAGAQGLEEVSHNPAAMGLLIECGMFDIATGSVLAMILTPHFQALHDSLRLGYRKLFFWVWVVPFLATLIGIWSSTWYDSSPEGGYHSGNAV